MKPTPSHPHVVVPPVGSPLHGMLRIHTSPMSGLVVDAVDGRALTIGTSTRIDFATGAYLGLDHDLTDADVAEARRWGLRNGWSRATGATGLTQALERELASALQMDHIRLSTSAALLAYAAFHGLCTAFSHVLYDAECHITLKQGIAAAYPAGRRLPVPHDDLSTLRDRLARVPAPALVVVDGVYSMEGREAPVEALARLCAAHGSVLFIDDVHGFGAQGPNGLGVIERIPSSLRQHVVLLGSFAKSASNPVAFLAYPSPHWAAVESIPALNYSGPPSNLHVAVARRHLASFRAYLPRRYRLFQLSHRLHRFCQGRGIHTRSVMGSPILAVGMEDVSMEAATRALADAGILCKVAVHPVVPRGEEVLRFTLTAVHSDAQIARLEQALVQIQPCLKRS